MKQNKYYVGIDLGGTFIKGGIVDESGNILVSDKTPTESEKGSDGVAKNIAALVLSLMQKQGLQTADVVGIGMGVPGMIDSKAGNVIYSNNLDWKDFRIGDKVETLTGLKVKIANDANVAALGEVKFGAAKNCNDVIMITLGTGVGGGIVLDGKLFEGFRSAGAEVGHTVVEVGGRKCGCGRCGCFEQYSSAMALIRDTKEAMEKAPGSAMWQVVEGDINKVSGSTAFKAAAQGDKTAQAVLDQYVRYLGEGIANLINIFRPEAVMLGGGVSNAGDALLTPVKAYVEQNIYVDTDYAPVDIVRATLGNDAGIYGAYAYALQREE